MTKPECSTCSNRGKVNGLSEEIFCSSCVHQESWRVDWYVPKQELDKLIPQTSILKVLADD